MHRQMPLISACLYTMHCNAEYTGAILKTRQACSGNHLTGPLNHLRADTTHTMDAMMVTPPSRMMA